MMARWWFTAKNFYNFKKQLKSVVTDTCNSRVSVTDIDSHYLVDHKIKGLILDFDGVLAAHGMLSMEPDAAVWLRDIIQTLPSLNVCVLTNKPMGERHEYFKSNFPTVQFITGVNKKPYPHGIEAFAKNTDISVENLLIVDDRLATGVLASILAGCKVCYIYPPRADLKNNSKVESFFMMLRRLERFMAKML